LFHIKLTYVFQKSTIIDFYPEDFKIDLNGKKFAWQGVALLPFVDEKRLFKAIKPFYNQLTDEESTFFFILENLLEL
jgi:5'-3' exonuclease